MNHKLFILVGNIASGKSSYCKNAAKFGQIICNDDDVVNAVHSNQYSLYDAKNKFIYKQIELSIICSGLSNLKSVVYDSGRNVSIRRRRRFIDIAHSFDLECEAIVFERNLPKIHADRRFLSDNRGLKFETWYKVASYFDGLWETPTLNEGFSQIHNISFEEIQLGKVFI